MVKVCQIQQKEMETKNRRKENLTAEIRMKRKERMQEY